MSRSAELKLSAGEQKLVTKAIKERERENLSILFSLNFKAQRTRTPPDLFPLKQHQFVRVRIFND